LPDDAVLDAGHVSVVVVEPGDGREISWGSNQVEKLSDRVRDLNDAVRAGVVALMNGLPDLPSLEGWELSEVTGSFGVTLTAGAGVILTRVGADAALKVEVKFTRAAHE
jgi:Trypsin-co-occurring domain 1